jgi:hypothetical protein
MHKTYPNIKNCKFNKPILSHQTGNIILAEYLLSDELFFAARVGNTEQTIVKSILIDEYSEDMYFKKDPKWCGYCGGRYSGIYPDTYVGLKNFADCYSKSLKNIDLTGVVTSFVGLDVVLNRYCPQAIYFYYSAYESYYFPNNPWTQYLKDKTVLVIHPFEKSIKNNFSNRANLFKNTNILPNFNLVTFKAHQNLGKENSDWFESLNIMKEEISKLKFDIAIIGCGAFGIPLGSFIKSHMNKSSIHIGGAIQLLFGILGNRWINEEALLPYVNSYWTKPMSHEIPENHEQVENSCYW